MTQRLTATIRSSGRVVSILLNGDEFFVVHPSRGAVAAGGWQSVSGPFRVTDARFRLLDAAGSNVGGLLPCCQDGTSADELREWTETQEVQP